MSETNTIIVLNNIPVPAFGLFLVFICILVSFCISNLIAIKLHDKMILNYCLLIFSSNWNWKIGIGKWKDLEGTLSQDMSTLSAYLQTWRLKLSHTKTVTTAFYLNNREAKRELKVYKNGRLLFIFIFILKKINKSLPLL